jgi:hypothetical protein
VIIISINLTAMLLVEKWAWILFAKIVLEAIITEKCTPIINKYGCMTFIATEMKCISVNAIMVDGGIIIVPIGMTFC